MGKQMLKAAVIGASGYTGVELAALVAQHPMLTLNGVYVSEHSADQGKSLAQLHGQWLGLLDDAILQPLSDDALTTLATQNDLVFLATDHKVSHDIAPKLLEHDIVVLDLSGGFRFKHAPIYEQYYGFTHQHADWLAQAVYGLAEWNEHAIRNATLIAVPGCYPTASLTALKPLAEANLIEAGYTPIINAVSGVSGAGRKAALTNSFCEVSLAPYGVLGHRHQPEISSQLGQEVIFTPHLGNFPRGIVATTTVKLNAGVSEADVSAAYHHAYQQCDYVRILKGNWPSIKQVAQTPYVDLAWKFDSHNQHLVAVAAIDNLLKGAASQAIQCANIRFNLGSFPLPEKTA